MQSGGSSSNFDRVCKFFLKNCRYVFPLDRVESHFSTYAFPFFELDRAYFSAINPSDIQKAYKVLGKPDKNQALSVDARQELDLKVGVAFSRFQTRYFQGRYGDLDR